jgi:formylglycine-generating enzyme
MLRHLVTRFRPIGARATLLSLLLLAASCSSDNRPYVPKPGTTYDPATGLPMEIISQKDEAEMVLVTAGSFKPGDPMGLHKTARVRAFYIDRHEVTNERYYQFTSATNRPTPKGNGEGAMLGWTNDGYPEGRGDCPVVLVTFDGARQYAEWAGKKMPTQVQWEFAARGPKATAYPWGDDKLPPADCNTSDRLAGKELLGSIMWQEWYETWLKKAPAVRNVEAVRPVGSFPKDVSAFGCLDMGGNVREWCSKRQKQQFGEGAEAPGYAGNVHVACGGSWFKDTSAARAWLYEIANACYDVGFRCVVPANDPDIRVLAKPAADKNDN